MQHFDLYTVSDLQGTNTSVLVATVSLRTQFVSLRTDEIIGWLCC